MELSPDEVRLIERQRAAKAMSPRTTLDSAEAVKCWLAHVLTDLKAEVSGIDAASWLDVKAIVVTMINRRMEALDSK